MKRIQPTKGRRSIAYLRSVLTLVAIMLSSMAYAAGEVTVTATAGNVGPTNYDGINQAFVAINAGTHQGNILINVTASYQEPFLEGVPFLNSSGAGAASYTSVLIQPTVDNVVITSAGGTNGFTRCLVLNGADNVTINGDNPNSGGTNRNLTFLATGSPSFFNHGSLLNIALSSANGVLSADNITIRNCIFSTPYSLNDAGRTNPSTAENTSFGILLSGEASSVTTFPSVRTSLTATTGTGVTADNLTIENNEITGVARGIGIMGGATTVATDLTIANNLIGDATGTSNTVSAVGIQAMGFDIGNISGNTIRNIRSYLTSSIGGILLGEVTTGATGINATVERNTLNGFFSQNTGTYGVYGISLSAGNDQTVQNNFIRDITHNMSSGAAFGTEGVSGIIVEFGNNHTVYHNTISLSGVLSGSAAGTHSSQALLVASATTTGLDIRNNIFSNTISGGSAGSIAHVSVMVPSGATSAMDLTLNNNAYFAGTGSGQGMAHAGAASFNTLYTVGNFNPADNVNPLNFRTYSSTLNAAGTNDDASLASAAAAPFVSATDLHIREVPSQLESGGASVGLATDYDGDARPGPGGSLNGGGTLPDIGADEFDGFPCTSGGWTGVTSTDWAEPSNWCNNATPSGDVFIPAGAANMPTINFSQAISDLTVLSGATLTISGPGGQLVLQGDLSNNGTITGTGSLMFNGGVPQTATGSGSISNLDINNVNGVTITNGNHINLTGILTLTNGVFTTNGDLTLKSTSIANTAMVAPLGSGSISGDVTVERFIPAKRAWRLLTAPVVGASNNMVWDNWQNAGVVNGSGVEIWGPTGTGSAGNGLEPIAAGGSYSMRTYDAAGNVWTNVTNTKTQPLFDASINNPFLVFVTGPYGNGGMNNNLPPAATTLKATGGLITGTKNYPFSTTLALIGNPYACPIDFDDIYTTSTDIQKRFYVWDPNLNTVGGYVLVEDAGGGYTVTPPSSQTQVIQNGQAFFVEAAVGTPIVTIEETDKETVAAQTAVFRTNGGMLEKLRVNLNSLPANNVPVLIDGALVKGHQNYNNGFTKSEDAYKFYNINESISIRSNGIKLASEGRQLLDNGDTVKIGLNGMRQASFQLEIAPENFNAPGLTATLYDTYLNTTAPVSISSNTFYSFSVNATAASGNDNRFFLVFNNSTPLDVKFASG